MFETISPSVETLPIPAWVFDEFVYPVVTRNFDYAAMLYSDGRYVNHFGNGLSVPDVSKLETQMFQYYLARSYIDAGMEALHFGQTALTGEADPVPHQFEPSFPENSRIRESPCAKGNGADQFPSNRSVR